MRLRTALLLLPILACQPAKKSEPTPTTDAGPLPPPLFTEPAMPAAAPFDLAGDFTIPTLAGDWNFKEHFTHEDAFVFIRLHTGSTYSQQLWNTPLNLLLTLSPGNTHYIYFSDDANAADEVATLSGKLETYFNSRTDMRDAWADRIHFVNVPTGELTGWLPLYLSTQGTLSFAIDRQQRVREVGLLGSPLQQNFVATATYLPNQVKAFNFEYDREQQLMAEENVTTVLLLSPVAQPSGGLASPSVVDVVLPDVTAFDTMAVDLTSGCPGNLDANCPDWDQIGSLFICSETPQDKCGNGTMDDGEQCDAGASNGTGACSRFCEDTTKAPHVCNQGIKMARWVTTYKRMGRWVTDISPFIGALSAGKHRFQYNSGGGSMATLSLRLRRLGAGAVPRAIKPLWGGGGFNQDYNSQHPAQQFTVPEGATRVQFVAFATGHGWGQDAENCAEFCDVTHEIIVNGHAAQTKNAPMAGTSDGCIKQIDQGVTPNQFGTWPLGRDGWCPGLDVKPWVVDITDQVQLTGSNTISYRGLFEGMDYTPMPASNPNPSGFGAQLSMSSYLVFSR